ncbi:MAG: histidine phosphatase family protein [Actinomycetes bacterium]
MPTLLLVRHGRTEANSSGVLAGWTPGVGLDDIGRSQATDLAARLTGLPLARVVRSPLQRCQETVDLLLAGRDGPAPVVDERLGECRYGDWTGQPITSLAKDPLWKVVQAHPSAVTFPGDQAESLLAMATRAVTAVRDWDARVRAEDGDDAIWLACSHADVIKAIVADALGVHLDFFQRIVVDPASVTVVRYTTLRPFVLRLNDTATSLASLRPVVRARRQRGQRASAASSDAVVGGGAGGTPTPASTPRSTRRATPTDRARLS